MTVEWFGDDILRDTNRVMARIEKEIAEDIEADSKKILKSKATTTTEKGLLSQFYIQKSKFSQGGYLIWCQGPKNWHPPYHASFLEMGTFKDQAKPFMRPGLKKNRRNAKRKLQEALDSI